MATTKKQLKIDDLFTVGFTDKSASVDKNSDHVWVWGNVPNYSQNTIFIKREIKTREGDRFITTDQLVPMAVVEIAEKIDIDTYAVNWQVLGYTKSARDKARASLKKFIEREQKTDGIVKLANDGYVNKNATLKHLRDRLEQSGVTLDSAIAVVGAMTSPQAALLGKKLESYYEVPELKFNALPSAPSVAIEDTAIEVEDTVTTIELEVTDSLENMTKAELINFATELGLQVSKTLTKVEIVELINSATK